MAEQNIEDNIRPKVSKEELQTLIGRIYGLKGGFLEQLRGYDDLNYHFKPNISCNPFIKTICPAGYVIKVMNSLDSVKEDLCEAQNAMMLFLRERGIPCPIPAQTFRGDYYKKEKFPLNIIIKKKNEHIIRILEFQNGTVLKEIPKSYPVFYKLGKFLGKLNEVLMDFEHPFYKNHKSIWHLNSAPEIDFYIPIIEAPQRRELVETIIKKFTEILKTKAESLERGMIHGDFNEHNVLMKKGSDGKWEVAAILDFGDSHNSYYLFELAIALCYMMFECKSQGLNPVVGAGHLLAGYLSVRPEFVVNYELLKLCICARICQSLVLGLRAFKINPDNTYVLDSQKQGWPLLEELWHVSEEEITKEWELVFQSYDIKR